MRPSIYRNSCGGENTHIREQEIGIQRLRHKLRLQRRGGSKLVSCCDGDAVLEAAVKDTTRWALTQIARRSRIHRHRQSLICINRHDLLINSDNFGLTFFPYCTASCESREGLINLGAQAYSVSTLDLDLVSTFLQFECVFLDPARERSVHCAQMSHPRGPRCSVERDHAPSTNRDKKSIRPEKLGPCRPSIVLFG